MDLEGSRLRGMNKRGQCSGGTVSFISRRSFMLDLTADRCEIGVGSGMNLECRTFECSLIFLYPTTQRTVWQAGHATNGSL